MKNVRTKLLSFFVACIFFLSSVVTIGVPAASALTEEDLEGIEGIPVLIDKFKKLTPEQVKNALTIGEDIIFDSDIIPGILTDDQKANLKSLGLTYDQVKYAYECVIDQLKTDDQIVELQNGNLEAYLEFVNKVSNKFSSEYKENLKNKGVTVSKLVLVALKVSELTFDPYGDIPKADLEKILKEDMGIATETATKYGLNWTNVEALRDTLDDNQKAQLIDILETLGMLTPRSSGGGGGGGGGTVSTGTRVVPSQGGTVEYNNAVTLEIPAGALQGTSSVKVEVEKVSSPAAAPAGFRILGSVYSITIDGQSSYTFNKPVTLTFTFDPDDLAPGEVPVVQYYDEETGTWVNLGGTVSGNTITVTIDHFTKFAVMAKEVTTLKDIAGHWAEDHIKLLVADGAITGYEDGTFKPDRNITRAEFATVLVRALKLDLQSGKVFNDTANHWAKDYIATAAWSGIVQGYDDATFGPDDLITREQMAVMVYRAAQFGIATGEMTFTDAASISSWAKEAVALMAEEGIITGYPDNTFKPQANATRAEAVTVIVRALKS